jgi:membrane associated rhomboid family serine protease
MNPFFRTPPVVKNLIIANCIVYLAVMLLPEVNHFCAQYLQLWWVDTYHYNFHSYQFITYMFLHGGFGHLFLNMFALWMFGRTLEYEIGSKKFLIYYMVCGIGAALFQIVLATLLGESMVLLGASGAVMGLLLAFGLMHPNNMVLVFPIPFPIKAKWYVIGYAVLEIVLGSSGIGSGIAHFAHVGGMLWGLALLLWWKKRGDIYF